MSSSPDPCAMRRARRGRIAVVAGANGREAGLDAVLETYRSPGASASSARIPSSSVTAGVQPGGGPETIQGRIISRGRAGRTPHSARTSSPDTFSKRATRSRSVSVSPPDAP